MKLIVLHFKPFQLIVQNYSTVKNIFQSIAKYCAIVYSKNA